MSRCCAVPFTLALALAALVGCHRDRAGDSSDAGAPPSSARNPTSAPTAKDDSPPRPYAFAPGAPPAGEAEWRTVRERNKDPVLRPFQSRVRAHFKDPEAVLVVQRAALFGGGWANLVTEQRESDLFPLLFVEDRERKLLWERERPTAGMMPPVRDPIVIARGKGGVALFAFDIPVRVLAGRLIDADGTPFADLNVLRTDDCRKLSAAYWPKRGIVVVCSRTRGSILQIVREDYTLAFGPEGIALGEPFRLPAAMSIAFDGADTMMLVQYTVIDGRDHVVVWRYDSKGKPIWPTARDIGEVPRVETPPPRIVTTGIPDGIRIELPRGTMANPALRAVEVFESGVVPK